MKRFSVVLVATVMAVAISACGKETTDQGSELNVQPIESTEQESIADAEPSADTEEVSEEASDSKLAVPEVKDGETRPGEDSVEVYFEWNPVEGADGYEVSEQSKFYGDEDFSDPADPVETTDTSYVTGAQDYFDFQIKVRAFKGSGDSRVYSDWSNEAVGFTYTDDEISSEIATVSFDSYDDLISAISEGLKSGFSEDEQVTLDISTCFFMNNSDYETLGYMKKDLDGDGSEELILGSNLVDVSDDGTDSIIYDIFTMKDGKVTHILTGWERNRYYLCTDGTVANEASGGAAYSSWAYYTIENGKAKIIESVFTDEDDNMEGHWYYSTKEPYQDESNEVTEDEGMKTIEKYTYQELEFTPFN